MARSSITYTTEGLTGPVPQHMTLRRQQMRKAVVSWLRSIKHRMVPATRGTCTRAHVVFSSSQARQPALLIKMLDMRHWVQQAVDTQLATGLVGISMPRMGTSAGSESENWEWAGRRPVLISFVRANCIHIAFNLRFRDHDLFRRQIGRSSWANMENYGTMSRAIANPNTTY